MSTEITITSTTIDINVSEYPITIEAPSGAYPLPTSVYSVFGRTGNVVAAEGDYTLTQLAGVTITSPVSGQALVYNGTSWVNNTETYVGTVTSVAALTLGTTGTDLTSSVVNSTTTPVITLNVPTASASNRGALSSADWSIFNAKQPALNGTGFVKISGTTISYDNSTYYLASNPTAYIPLTALSSTATGLTYTNTTGVFSTTGGYGIPTTAKQTTWDTAYNDSIISASVTGVTTKTLTLNQQDGGTIVTTWTDYDTAPVTSVFGRTGAVVAVIGDYTTSLVTEGTNLYYTQARFNTAFAAKSTTDLAEGTNLYYTDVRARASNSFVAGSGAYNSTTGVITIPTNNNQITNGSAYITLTSLSVTTPLSYNNTTGAFTISQSNTSTNGYLSFTDWNTFNGKQAALNGTGFVKISGTTISYDNSTYLTTIAGITAGGELSGTYASPSLVNSAVIGKVLTGVNITGGTIAATDSILTAFGKVQNQINGLIGGSIYQGTWNASTNTPTLTSSVGTAGYYYIVSVAGTTNLNGITDWQIGDWAIFNGGAWQKVDNTDSVVSVNGFTGAVSLSTSNINEGSNLYFTNARTIASTLTGYTSGAGTVSATDTILTAIQKLNGNVSSIISGVSSVYGRTGAVVATSGDYTTTQVTEGTNLYFTDTRARAAISLTTTGTSGAATYTSGVINIPQYQGVLTNPVTGTGTTNYLPKFTGTSAIGNSNITDTGSLITLGSNTYISSGGLGIGSTTLTGYSLRVGKLITGATTSIGVYQSGQVQSDVTVATYGFYNEVNTQATAFTLTSYYHYGAAQGTIGASSAITTQTGFYVPSTLTGATNNYGFRGVIASGTNRWNLYMDGTAANYMAGVLNIGTTTLSGYSLDVSGTTRFVGTTASDTAPLGSELAAVTGTGASWTLAGTNLNVGGYTHTVGSTTALTTALAAVNGTYYQIAYTITGRTAGSITIAYGGISTTVSATGATGPQASSTAVLTITPTTDFDGTIVLSIKSIGTSSASSTFANSGGTSVLEIRASSITTNTFIGLSSGSRNTTGTSNTFIGIIAGRENTTGSDNTFIGTGSGQVNTISGSNTFVGTNSGLLNTTGSNNTFLGKSAGQANTTGGSNTFVGRTAGTQNTTGTENTFVGQSAGENNSSGNNNTFIGREAGLANTTGVNNVGLGWNALRFQQTGYGNIGIGYNAGRFITGGSTANTISINSIFLGFDSRAAADNQTNQIVIGYQTTGLGSNTTILGNASTTLTALYGSVITGGTSVNASAQLQVDSTTKGFLPPRGTNAQRNAITSPAVGLIFYCTDSVEGLYIYTSSGWKSLTMV